MKEMKKKITEGGEDKTNFKKMTPNLEQSILNE